MPILRRGSEPEFASLESMLKGLFLTDHGKAHPMAQQGINVLALLKGEERYVFLYDDHSLQQVLQTLGRYAADPELSFTWYDAAVLSQRIRQLDESRDEAPAAADPAPAPKNRIGRSAA